MAATRRRPGRDRGPGARLGPYVGSPSISSSGRGTIERLAADRYAVTPDRSRASLEVEGTTRRRSSGGGGTTGGRVRLRAAARLAPGGSLDLSRGWGPGPVGGLGRGERASCGARGRCRADPRPGADALAPFCSGEPVHRRRPPRLRRATGSLRWRASCGGWGRGDRAARRDRGRGPVGGERTAGVAGRDRDLGGSPDRDDDGPRRAPPAGAADRQPRGGGQVVPRLLGRSRAAPRPPAARAVTSAPLHRARPATAAAHSARTDQERLAVP